jgi:hypothetical protein
MLSKANFSLMTLVILICLVTAQLPVDACATCGCSEVCPLTAMDASVVEQDRSLLSNSIWGNIILKMAYARDPEVLRLSRKLKVTNLGTTTGLAGVAGGTAAQGIVGMATLNPSDGNPDSYAPGITGVGLEVAVLMIFAGGPLIQHKFRKQLKARQVVLRQQVEQILQHLEYSKTNCSEAQKELAELIGERGARDCIQLWQSSHQLALSTPARISVIDKAEIQQ